MVYPLTPPMLDLMILSIVNKEDSYGYQISQQLKGLSNMKDSALYPILRKLSDNGYVETYDQPYQGRNRKYYRITPPGRLQCSYLYKEWLSYTQAVNRIIIGNDALKVQLLPQAGEASQTLSAETR